MAPLKNSCPDSVLEANCVSKTSQQAEDFLLMDGWAAGKHSREILPLSEMKH